MKKYHAWISRTCLAIAAIAFVGLPVSIRIFPGIASLVHGAITAHAQDQGDDEDTISPPPQPPAPPAGADRPDQSAIDASHATSTPTPTPVSADDTTDSSTDDSAAPYSDIVPKANTPETPVAEVAPQTTPAESSPVIATKGFWDFIPFVNKTPKTPTTVTPTVPGVRKTPTTTKPITVAKKKSYNIVSVQYTLNGVLVHTSDGPDDTWQLDTTTLQNGTYTLNTFINYGDGTSDNGNNTFTVDNTPSFFDQVKGFLKGLLPFKKK